MPYLLEHHRGGKADETLDYFCEMLKTGSDKCVFRCSNLKQKVKCITLSEVLWVCEIH